LEDYIHILLPLLDFAPEIFFRSTAFPIAFKVCISALSLIYTDILAAALDLTRNILHHDCLNPPAVSPPLFAQYAASIEAVLQQEGQALLDYLLNGIVSGDFVEELMPPVISIFRAIAAHWPQDLELWLTPALQRLPTTTVPNETKATFVTDISRSVAEFMLDFWEG
jgi:transportin-3